MTQYIKFLGYISWVGLIAVLAGIGTEYRDGSSEQSFVSEVIARDVAPVTSNDETATQEIIAQCQNDLEVFLVQHGGFLIEQAKREKIDYRLILAVVKQESAFDNEAISHRGAFGFMQIMPRTFGTVDRDMPSRLSPAEQNLYVGINYLRELIRSFSHNARSADDAIALALAAYNAGPARVHDAQAICRYRNTMPGEWAQVAEALPVLSENFHDVHDSVWSDAPPSGSFGGSRETLEYVEKVMASYKYFKHSLPTIE